MVTNQSISSTNWTATDALVEFGSPALARLVITDELRIATSNDLPGTMLTKAVPPHSDTQHGDSHGDTPHGDSHQ